ncbi:hypothetical protein SteCoe_33944 [Stentor coeruleus]|uniref:HECT-type E3 ubiquitin transferase n=1 Tax=Stentor coeruleus TaxID=5963 RepID=A0A1R2AVM4_9CILI|nr:hypothetical protein SteCoe_37973 [Stentor coeruleus]OMJ68568.1 hypothetical protein SteCoe_33944 [Stentor coeruleus]
MFTPYERPGKKGVEEAKQSLQKAMESKKYSKACLNIQRLWRQFQATEKVREIIRSKTQSKISDIKKLKSMLGDKLKNLPIKTLLDLIRLCKISKDPNSVYELRDWIEKSLSNPDPAINFMSNINNWDVFIYVITSIGSLYKKNKDADKFIVSVLMNTDKVSYFYRFLVFMQLVNEEMLLKNAKKYLMQEILLASDNVLSKSIANTIDLVIVSNVLFYEIDISVLKNEDKSLVYNGFVEIQAYVVDEILSIPRIAKFILQHPRFYDVKWKEMIQSYCYTQVAPTVTVYGYSEKEIFLFGNLWELFQTRLLNSMTPSDIAHFLITCTKLVKNLTPKLLECSPSASIVEPINLKTLRRQISLFTDSSRLGIVFMKIFNHESQGFDDSFNPTAAQSLCEIYNIFLEKCRDSKEAQFVVTGIMGGLAFNQKILYKIWKFLETFCDLRQFYNLKSFQNQDSNVYKFSSVLSIFCSAYRNLLLISNDEEFPYIFTKDELLTFTFFSIGFIHTLLSTSKINDTTENLLKSLCQLLTLIHEFNTRLKFIEEKEFHFNQDTIDIICSTQEALNRVLGFFPFCLPFDDRAEILISRIMQTKDIYSGYQSTKIVVRRDNFMADSIAQLLMVPDVRGRLEVKFINIFGTVEEGYDAGGLFKEFWTSLSQEAFNPQYGLFSVSNDRCLYPNPESELFFGDKHLEMFYLVGRILGKAIFERITVEPTFAEFFLRKMIGKYNFIEDLKSLDKEVYNNLMFLKTYEGNVEDLSLTFIVNTVGGQEIELKPKGRDIPVTNLNKLEYIYKLADYRLNLQIKNQCTAFFRGFSELIPGNWVCCFTSYEMQKLISGTTESIDLQDLKAYTAYIDCSSWDDCVKNFWKVMESFDDEERSLVLKFVTSCHRPPLMGFKNLFPPFTLSKARIDRDDEKLPSSQTCMNILRIPTYSSWKVLREKLIIAIRSNAGFEFR